MDRRKHAALLLPLLVLLLGGCTDDARPPETRRPEVALDLTLSDGVSQLSPEKRGELQTAVGDVLKTYVVAGFLGNYPREDFVSALDSFTGTVARRAAQHLNVLTALRFGESEEVVARRLSANISAFTPGEELVGATARVDFAFHVVDADGQERDIVLDGRLMLRPQDGAWKIFGYDVDLDDGAAEAGASG